MTQEKREFEDWLRQAHQAKRVALLAHVSPDGDTMGSTLALRLAFLALGKQADVICDGDMPDNLKYLPGSEAMQICSFGAYTMCSYTSSVTTNASYFFASSPMVISSSRVNTLPQGLEGLQTMIAFAPSSRKAASIREASK